MLQDRNEMPADPVVLDADARQQVSAAIKRHADFRVWTLLALNVRTTHVHVVVSTNVTPERAMNEFKSYSTRALRHAALVAPDVRVWARHGSTRHLFFREALEGAIQYVTHGQGPEPSW
jgi:REP element-mobilizing transposase RayT